MKASDNRIASASEMLLLVAPARAQFAISLSTRLNGLPVAGNQNIPIEERRGYTMKMLRRVLLIVLIFAADQTFYAGAQTVTILHSFVGPPTDGTILLAGLVEGSDGNFYGTTGFGGTSTNCNGGCGTVFRISPGGSYTTLYSFVGYPSDGFYPRAGLLQGSDSNFYGTTTEGGSDNNGTVFRISPTGTETILYSFVGSSHNDGAEPEAGLVQGSDGNFYGTTYYGGSNSDGTVFRISPSGSETNLYSFVGPPTDGANPNGGLVQGSDGSFYGTTLSGGTNYGDGTVFRISPSGSYTNLHSFIPSDGAAPAGLVQGSDGNFYGTTSQGGTSNNEGTVFRISPNGSLTNLHLFGALPTDGANPSGGLVQGSDGSFYGTTSFGGTSTNCGSGCGTVYRISPSGTYTSLYSFVGSPDDGAWPFVGLVQGSDGNFYGTTYYGGTDNTGTVFKLDVGLAPLSNSCLYSLSTDNASYSGGGGDGSVTVAASGTDCPWTAISNDSFITITSGTNGTGVGTVSYTVAADSAAARTGTMTIGGHTFTVDQTTLGFAFTHPVQTCKTRIDKKTTTTNTTCTVAFDLAVSNAGAMETPGFSVLFWFGQGSTFNPNVGPVLLAKKVKALKEGKSVTIKVKESKLNGDQAGTFIFATDSGTNVLASVQLPAPE